VAFLFSSIGSWIKRIPHAHAIGSDLTKEIKVWLNKRRDAGFVLAPQTPLFEREDGQPDTLWNAGMRFNTLFRRCEFKPPRGGGRVGLRVHDLRHNYAVHRLQNWYRAGLDPTPLLALAFRLHGAREPSWHTALFVRDPPDAVNRLASVPTQRGFRRVGAVKSPDPLFDAVEAFFVDCLKLARGCSPCTLRNYRDTLRLLFEYAGRVRSLSVDRLRIADFDADLIFAFLNHLEKDRHNRVSTRNCWRGSDQLRPKFITVALLKERERANPTHLVARNWIVLDPVAAGILVEVGTSVGALVDR
jgi:hypothetical protein